MSDTGRSTRYAYRHKSKQEMIAFIGAHLKAKVSNNISDTSLKNDVKSRLKCQTLTGEHVATRTATADEELFDTMVSMIDNDKLVCHLASLYKDKGKDAVEYLKKCFDNGDQDDKLSDACDAFLAILTMKLTPGIETESFSDLCDDLLLQAVNLEGSHCEFSQAQIAGMMIDWVRKIDGDYRSEVRHRMSKSST